MALNPKYMIAPSQQEVFFDKDTGELLAGGIVSYYSDTNRSTLKSIYTLSGNPEDGYTYVELPNPLTLSAIGTPMDDNNNDVLVYYYPYDDDGNIELYFTSVESAGGVPQFTRSAWPNLISGGGETVTSEIVNYIPNGQFLVHTNIPSTDTTTEGQVTQDQTILSQGGWSFNRLAGNTSTDFVTFESFGYTDSPEGNPPFSVRIQTTVSDGNYKTLRIQWPDVNKFASDDQSFTFAFSGISNSGSPLTIQAWLLKNYGTGGSATTLTQINPAQPIIIPTGDYAKITEFFEFGDNDGKTIGTDGDDYVAIELRFPASVTFDVSLTNFLLLVNQVSPANFPSTTNAQMLSETLAGWSTVPAYDASNLYLPWVLTPTGTKFDDSLIGKIFASSSGIIEIGELLCDGNSYIATQYSSDGIPYSRLQQKYLYQQNGQLKNPSGIPTYGTGAGYFTGVFVAGTAGEIILHNNTAGSVTNTADGANPTNFTFSVVGNGAASYLVDAYWDPNINTIWMRNQTAGSATASSAGTSGFFVNTYLAGNAPADPQVKNISTIDTTSATGLEGKYWTFNNTVGNFYVWYKVDGAGVDPAPGGTGILVNILGTDSDITVSQKTANTLNAWEVSDIIVNAANTFAGGAYFTANSTSGGYYIWYTIDGVGTDPNVAGRTGIKVAVLSDDTAEPVAIKTVVAINAYSYAVPNLQGYFLRGTDPTSTIDNLFRASLVDYAIDNVDRLGTIQFDTNQNHLHGISAVPVEVAIGGTDKLVNSTNLTGAGTLAARPIGDDGFDFSATAFLSGQADGNTEYSGFSQTQPQNANVMYLVKY